MKALDRMITSCLVLALSFGYTSAKANPLCINCGSDQEVIPVHYEISQGCGASSKPVPDIRQDGLHVHVFIVGIPSDWLKQQHPQWYCKKCHLQFAGQAWTATSSSGPVPYEAMIEVSSGGGYGGGLTSIQVEKHASKYSGQAISNRWVTPPVVQQLAVEAEEFSSMWKIVESLRLLDQKQDPSELPYPDANCYRLDLTSTSADGKSIKNSLVWYSQSGTFPKVKPLFDKMFFLGHFTPALH